LYLHYFGLSEAPFSITPDPAFVYLSARHRDALAHLLYGVGQGGSGGFVQLTGEVGTGKTTLCRCLLEQVPEGTRIALILNPMVTAVELLTAICEELRIPVADAGGSSKELVDRLTRFLLEAHQAGDRIVVVIDEAQNLSPEALEQVRLLTNLETSKEKLLQIVLLGQPELREMLQRRDLRQLAQRITARYHLTPLGSTDTAEYIRHRLQVAGAERNPFRRSAMKALFQRSHGVPRLINIIADRSLVGAYARERQDVDARTVHAAANEIQLGEPGLRRNPWPWALAAAAVILLAVAIWATLPLEPAKLPPEAVAVTVPPADPARVLQAETEPAVPGPAGQEQAASVGIEIEEVQTSAPPVLSALDEGWLETQSVAAWQGMASAWGDPAGGRSVESACQGGQGTGYACVYNQGNWSRIRQLGLPVVLVLSGQPERYLLLRGLDDRRLLVGTESTSRTIARDAIEERWLGAYLVAWPQSPNWPRQISRGDSGPAVQRVLSLAAAADPPYSGSARFNVGFENWLKEFQQKHGLEMDGIVGPKTLLYLMQGSIHEPALLSDWPESS